eukprot:scaffold64590_cov32-Tisochrysis_lutea.AAC.4
MIGRSRTSHLIDEAPDARPIVARVGLFKRMQVIVLGEVRGHVPPTHRRQVASWSACTCDTCLLARGSAQWEQCARRPSRREKPRAVLQFYAVQLDPLKMDRPIRRKRRGCPSLRPHHSLKLRAHSLCIRPPLSAPQCASQAAKARNLDPPLERFAAEAL